jgi:hypothetical protein
MHTQLNIVDDGSFILGRGQFVNVTGPSIDWSDLKLISIPVNVEENNIVEIKLHSTSNISDFFIDREMK